jgi:hypothetical protein
MISSGWDITNLCSLSAISNGSSTMSHMNLSHFRFLPPLCLHCSVDMNEVGPVDHLTNQCLRFRSQS